MNIWNSSIHKDAEKKKQESDSPWCKGVFQQYGNENNGEHVQLITL